MRISILLKEINTEYLQHALSDIFRDVDGFFFTGEECYEICLAMK